MPPPDNGNEFISFVDLMALDKQGQEVFVSKALAFGPASGTRAYGGHVFAQACYAAAQTVAKGAVLHNVTGWFLVAGKTNERFRYHVRRIRDGGVCTRGVDVYQDNSDECCFTCVCSFKRAERHTSRKFDVSQRLDLRKHFAVALGDKQPWDHPEMPSLDAPWFWEYSRKHNFNDPFPGLDLRKVNMDDFNRDKPQLERRNLKYYCVRGPMPSVDEDPNLHLAGHLYASDRNSLFVISNNLEIGNDYSAAASLAHTVIFHADAQELNMLNPDDRKPRWFCQEAWAGGARQGRGLHESRMWREDGLHIASTLQDGLIRLRSPNQKGRQGFSSEGMIENMEKARQAVQSKI